MNEIFVEEENTVYELDPECLKRKEEQRKRQETDKKENLGKNDYQMQKTQRERKQNNLWIICLLLLIINQ